MDKGEEGCPGPTRGTVCTAWRHQIWLYSSNVRICGNCLCASVSRYVSAVHQLPVSAAEHWWARQATARPSRSTHHVPHSHRSGVCSLEDCICQLNLGKSSFPFLTSCSCHRWQKRIMKLSSFVGVFCICDSILQKFENC